MTTTETTKIIQDINQARITNSCEALDDFKELNLIYKEIVSLSEKGFDRSTILGMIESYCFTPKVTQETTEIPAPVIELKDSSVERATVVQEGSSGQHNVTRIEHLGKVSIAQSVTVKAPVPQLVLVPENCDNHLKKVTEPDICVCNPTKVFDNDSSEEIDFAGIDLGFSFTDENLISIAFSDFSTPVKMTNAPLQKKLKQLRSVSKLLNSGNITKLENDELSNLKSSIGNLTKSTIKLLKIKRVKKVYLGDVSGNSKTVMSLISESLTSRLKKENIDYELVEEYQTSLISSLDNESFDKLNSDLLGKRTNHYFKTATNTVDADINAAYNIIRRGSSLSFKVDKNFVPACYNFKYCNGCNL